MVIAFVNFSEDILTTLVKINLSFHSHFFFAIHPLGWGNTGVAAGVFGIWIRSSVGFI